MPDASYLSLGVQELDRWAGDAKQAPKGGAASAPLPRALAMVVLLASLFFHAGCAGPGSAPGDDPLRGSEDGDRTVRITVENRNFKDATVWARWNGDRVRVGRVTGNTTETFEIRYWNDDVRFEVRFLAGGGYTGESIPVSPGEHLELTIRPTG